MEREVNSRLTGYAVSVRALHVHPWIESLELVDATISQDPNPQPPVALIRSLTARLHWRALVHGKIVADVTFDRPALAGDTDAHRTLGQRLYEGVVGVAAKILKNRPRGEVATVVTISGRADQPQYSNWEIVGGLLRNAFIKAIRRSAEPEGCASGCDRITRPRARRRRWDSRGAPSRMSS